MFLLVPTYPGCPRPKAIKQLCVCVHVCYSPNETFPGTGSASGAYWTSVQKHTYLVTTIVIVCYLAEDLQCLMTQTMHL